jgi:hypothetical protein
MRSPAMQTLPWKLASNANVAVGPQIPTPNNLDRPTTANLLSLTTESLIQHRQRATHITCAASPPPRELL